MRTDGRKTTTWTCTWEHWNLRRLGRPDQRHWPFPVLDSRIKAARTRTLFAFVTWLMSRLATYPCATQEQQLCAKVRAVCCWDTRHCAEYLQHEQKDQNESAGGAADNMAVQVCTQHPTNGLGSSCIAQRRLLYKVRPKTHYFTHMVDHHEETCLCLLHLSTFWWRGFHG